MIEIWYARIADWVDQSDWEPDLRDEVSRALRACCVGDDDYLPLIKQLAGRPDSSEVCLALLLCRGEVNLVDLKSPIRLGRRTNSEYFWNN